ncbi:acyclic terpene utilization AtuA family protein [Parasphingorhabdus sp.]|uniref:acyclic terpene utilization AtuA family protein n=1 Tax=Parasphingorhabdus sp. TaxID=2709688 RepID=UPI003A9261F9
MKISIGCGSAMAGHRLEPAIQLADSGKVDYLAFDCLAERTLALAQIRKRNDPETGYDLQLGDICRRFTPFLGRGGTIVGNFGSANPEAGAKLALQCFRESGFQDLKIGVVHGDDVLDQILELNVELPELGCRVRDLGDQVISAHAYIGAESIVTLLEQGSQFILGGRIADPSLYVGPICHELGWAADDWDGLAHAILAGHLLECGDHITGGNFADPPYRIVPDLHDLAYPMAEVTKDWIEVTKLPGTGGRLDAQTVKAQLAYEIHDPSRYFTPDVVADFCEVVVEDVAPDRVRVYGATAHRRPADLKIMVGLDYGWKVVGEMSFGGPGCMDRAQLAEEVIRKRAETLGGDILDTRADLQGYNSLHDGLLQKDNQDNPQELRLRFAARCRTEAAAQALGQQLEMVTYFGPAGGGGHARSIAPFIGVTPAFLPREHVNITTEVLSL